MTVPDLLDDRDVGGQIADPDPGHVHERQHDPARKQARRAQEHHRIDSHHFQRVDLVVDTHRAKLRDDAGADLGRHHVAEGIGDGLAQVTPRGEYARDAGAPWASAK